MVTRPKSPDGRRVLMGVKFSASEAAMVDAARGELTRSEWLRSVAGAAARVELDSRLRERTGAGLVIDERMPAGIAVLHSPGFEPAFITGRLDADGYEDEPERPPCKHRAGDVRDGVCVCGEEFYG